MESSEIVTAKTRHENNIVSSERPSSMTTYTMDEVVDLIGIGSFHHKLLFLCGVGYFAEITELVVVSFVAPSIQRQMGLSNLQYSLLGSSSFIGMAAGALFWGYVSDHYGRKLSFSLTVWLTFLGGFFSALAPNYATLLLLRFTAAFGIGGMLPVDYTVFLEFLPARKRGSYIVLVDSIGVVPALTLSATIAWYFAGDVVQWRSVLMLSSVPVGVMALLRRHVPESPRYYLAAGETDEAQRIIQDVADANSAQLPMNWRLLSEEEEKKKQGKNDGKDHRKIVKNQSQASSSPQDPLSSNTNYSAVPNTDTEVEMCSKNQPVYCEHRDPSSDHVRLLQQQNLNESEVDATSYHNFHRSDDKDDNEHNGKGIKFGVRSSASPSKHHDEISELLMDPSLRSISYRLWVIFFCLQLSASGMVFALPKLFDETFPGKTEREIALDLLIGVVGLIPGLAIAYVAVEWSRTRTLAAFSVMAGISVGCLGHAFLIKHSHGWALCMSIFLRGAMEGCFALVNTTAVESYPTLLRASGLGTAQIFDHVAGFFSPIIFGSLNASQSTRPYIFLLYASAFVLASIPALGLKEHAQIR